MASFADYTAAVYDVRMTQGDTFVEELVLEDGDGSPFPLAGYSFKSQLRRAPDNELIAEFDVLINAPKVTRSLSSTVTSTLSGEYVHDFQWTDPAGRVRTLFSGKFEVESEVTR